MRLDRGIFDGQESMCKIMKLNMVAMSKDGTEWTARFPSSPVGGQGARGC